MSGNNYSAISRDGLWTNNAALVQVLGLCPLLAVTNTAVNGHRPGLATMLTLILSNGTISLIRHQLGRRSASRSSCWSSPRSSPRSNWR
jgi:Na+-translocating ferredoxin:NAD+ oxidoreductase subunit E